MNKDLPRAGLATAALLVAIPSPGLAQGEAGPGARRHIIEIEDFEFRPARLEVPPGDTVVWINRDVVPHTATAASRDGWDSGGLTKDAEWSWVASGKGEVFYLCEYHPSMQGRVLVRNPQNQDRRRRR